MNKDNKQQSSPFHSDVFSVIFNASVEGILVVDVDGNIVISNPSCGELFGYTNEELKTKKVEDLVPNKYQKQHKKLRSKYTENPEPRKMGHGRDLEGLRKDGSVFPIEISLTHTEYEGKKLILAFVIDITERAKADEALKRSEDQLLKYASELEEKVQERTKRLKESANSLELSNEKLKKEVNERKKAEQDAKIALEKERELSELKSRFVSMASHEFRTPLSTILSSASLIAKYIDEAAQDKRLKHVNRIKSNVDDLTSILNDFLSLAKLEEGKIKNEPARFEVNEHIAELLEGMKLSLKKDQQLILEQLPSTLEMELDKSHLTSIINNLTSNAIKYSPEGSEIKVLLSRTDTYLKIDVIDKGMGIPVNEQNHLFERFFRAKNAINIQGTGLGLNLIKKYIELVKGDISFTSKEGVGTTFSVNIPIKPS